MVKINFVLYQDFGLPQAVTQKDHELDQNNVIFPIKILFAVNWTNWFL